MDITEFLLARIAEDEAVAREAAQALQGAGANWANTFKQVEGSDHQSVADATSAWYADHIARHDPARAVAECSAKRAIISEWAYSLQYDAWQFDPKEVGYFEGLYRSVRIIASVYSDHQDYQQEWSL